MFWIYQWIRYHRLVTWFQLDHLLVIQFLSSYSFWNMDLCMFCDVNIIAQLEWCLMILAAYALFLNLKRAHVFWFHILWSIPPFIVREIISNSYLSHFISVHPKHEEAVKGAISGNRVVKIIVVIIPLCMLVIDEIRYHWGSSILLQAVNRGTLLKLPFTTIFEYLQVALLLASQ